MKSKYTEDAAQRDELKNEVQMAVDKAKEIAERNRKDLPEDTIPVPESEMETPDQNLENIMVPIN